MVKNMKKIILTIILMLNIGIANAALPIGGYVGIRGGASVKGQEETKDTYKIKSEKSPMASVNAGVRLGSLRGELEYLYRYKVQSIKFNNGSDKDVSSKSVMGNMYYNALSLPFLRLYINAGVGYTDFSTNIIKDGSFTYSLGFGVSLTMAEFFSIDAGTRYFDMGKAEINGQKTRLYANDLYLGFRFGF